MAEFKVVINDTKSGKTYQKVIEDKLLVGKKIGDKISGDSLGLAGYELEVRGGSDTAGFPMRKEVAGSGRKAIVMSKGAGFNPVKRKKQHTQGHFFLTKKKTVRGNTISEKTVQVNLKVINYGKKALEELLGAKAEEAKPEEKK